MTTGSLKIAMSSAVYTDIGKIRKFNEDSFYVSQTHNLVVVCDGMGGQVAGGLASKIAVETIKDIYEALTNEQIQHLFDSEDETIHPASKRLVVAVRTANRRLYSLAIKFPKLRGMGTTVVAIALDETFATMVHVGDSRIFRIASKEVVQLTLDHSWLNELIEDNEINEEQLETFAQRNVITRALGTSPTVKIDVHCEKYKKNDIYILSTDGFHNTMKTKDIKKILVGNGKDMHLFASSLLEKAKYRDGSDNITVGVVRINQDSRQSSARGTAITIPAEDALIITKTDKFIREQYSEPKLNRDIKPELAKMDHKKFLFPALVLLTGLISFTLGMLLQSTTSDPRQDLRAAPLQDASALPVPIHMEQQRQSYIQNTAAPPGPSELREDAVLAFVFFNSMEDYESAALPQRGKVLDKIQPYLTPDEAAFVGNFSIFLIDSSNNVILKSSGLELPPQATEQ